MKKIFTAGLLLLAGAMSLSAQSPYEGSEPTNDGEFYLYNVETGLWFQGYTAIPGADRERWNTAANVGDYGRPLKFQSQDNGSWRLNTLAGDEYLGSEHAENGGGLLYLDNGTDRATWTLTGNATDGYVITYGERTLGIRNETYDGINYPVLVNDATENTHWQLVTDAERREFMANATEENPQDVSWLMINPELMNNDHRTPQWSVTRENGGEGWPDGYHPNRLFEAYNYLNIDFYQELSVPNGVYELTTHSFFSPTEGNPTNYGDYLDYTERGDKTVKAVLYANSDFVKLPSIYSFTSPTPVGDYAAKQLLNGGISIVDGWWQGARAMGEDDQFKSDPVTVTVTDGKLRLGIKGANSSVFSSWIVIGNFSLKYLGDVNTSILTETLQNTLEKAQAFDGNTSVYYKSRLTDAITAAEGVISSTDVNDLMNANNNLNDALLAANAIDTSELIATVSLAEADGIDTTEAENLLENATEPSQVRNMVNDLNLARKIANIETDNATYEGHAPAEGKFYLYNVGRKAYLTNGSDWGTHAALGYPGLEATLAEYGDGYTIQFNTLIQGDARDKFLNGSPYCDSSDGDKGTYVFEEIDGRSNVYAIKQIDKDGFHYLAFDPNGAVDDGGILHYNTVTSYWETPANEDAYWMLVTKEDRLAQMDNASWLNPVDVTVLIQNASFNKYENLVENDVNPWEGINQGWEWDNRHFGDKNTECFGDPENDGYNLTQNVTLPKKGWYEVSVQAYYRDGSIMVHQGNYATGKELRNDAVIYADLEETPLKFIHEEANKIIGVGPKTGAGEVPDNMIDASNYFETGLYWNHVTYYAEADEHDLSIGIFKYGENKEQDWIVADNFRIKYMGTQTNGIDEILDDVKVEDEFKGDNVIYNLQGIRVANPTNGIFIKNGKKVYIK